MTSPRDLSGARSCCSSSPRGRRTPRLVLLDELKAGVTRLLRERMSQLILASRADITVLMVEGTPAVPRLPLPATSSSWPSQDIAPLDGRTAREPRRRGRYLGHRTRDVLSRPLPQRSPSIPARRRPRRRPRPPPPPRGVPGNQGRSRRLRRPPITRACPRGQGPPPSGDRGPNVAGIDPDETIAGSSSRRAARSGCVSPATGLTADKLVRRGMAYVPQVANVFPR